MTKALAQAGMTAGLALALRQQPGLRGWFSIYGRKVQGWDAGTGRLTIHPVIGIFG